jgi:dTDP-4-amino-4,6-dideoxygalactose transaminase
VLSAHLADIWHGDSKDGTSRSLVSVVRRTGIATSGLGVVFGCTSFLPSKPLGCYDDGGAIFTNDRSVVQACREIRVH